MTLLLETAFTPEKDVAPSAVASRAQNKEARAETTDRFAFQAAYDTVDDTTQSADATIETTQSAQSEATLTSTTISVKSEPFGLESDHVVSTGGRASIDVWRHGDEALSQDALEFGSHGATRTNASDNVADDAEIALSGGLKAEASTRAFSDPIGRQAEAVELAVTVQSGRGAAAGGASEIVRPEAREAAAANPRAQLSQPALSETKPVATQAAEAAQLGPQQAVPQPVSPQEVAQQQIIQQQDGAERATAASAETSFDTPATTPASATIARSAAPLEDGPSEAAVKPAATDVVGADSVASLAGDVAPTEEEARLAVAPTTAGDSHLAKAPASAQTDVSAKAAPPALPSDGAPTATPFADASQSVSLGDDLALLPDAETAVVGGSGGAGGSSGVTASATTAASASAPSNGAGQNVVGQVVAAVVAKPGESRIELRLDPPELGRVDIEFAFDNDGVKVVLRAEREEALDLMRRHSDELVRELKQAGLDLGDLSFAAGGEQNQQSAHRSDSAYDFASANGDRSTLSVSADPTALQSSDWTGGGLDLRL